MLVPLTTNVWAIHKRERHTYRRKVLGHVIAFNAQQALVLAEKSKGGASAKSYTLRTSARRLARAWTCEPRAHAIG